MAYFIPDKTGTNPAYYVPNQKKCVVTDAQRIELFNPVFLDTLKVTLEGTVTSPFVRDFDWTITKDDYDWDAMGRMTLLDPAFDKKLVKSFTILKPFVAAYALNCAYNQLYPNEISFILQNPNNDTVITPEVIWALLQDVDNLKLATAPVKDVHASTEKKPMLLPPDPNKEYASTNLVDGEVWTVDTTANKKILFPVAGAFFRDSMVIVRGSYDTVDGHPADEYLKEGVDYIITAPDAYGMYNTSNASGVYQLVVFLSAFVGQVTIKYHAYGGSVTQYDIRQLSESLTNMYSYVTAAQILTANTLGATPLMMQVAAKIKALEDEVRKLSLKGQPSYADTGGCLLKKITAVDSDLHWWTIAKLYQVANNNGTAGDVYTADIAHFQLQTLYSKMLIDFTVAVNINKDDPTLLLPHEMNVQTISSLVPQGYIPYKDNSQLEQVIRPQLRIIYNRNTIEGSGVYLQIGLKLKRAEETLAIADLSGPESCWRLIDSPTEAVSPEDDHILLPNPVHYWDTVNPDSYSESCLIPLADGHVCWAGSQPLNRPNSGWQDFTLLHFLEKEIDISRLKNIKLYLEESNSNRFIINLEPCGTDKEITAVGTFTYASKAASLVVKFIRNPVTNELTLSLSAEIVAGITSNELNLKYVVVNT